MNSSQEIIEKSERLPFDPYALVVGIRRKLKWFAVVVVLALLFGATVGVVLGERSWNSYCVMLYQPPSVELSGRVYEPPAVQTQLNLVKLRRNIEAIRERLQIPTSLETLSAACDISNPAGTQLLVVRGTADSSQQSAEIANTLAEVFIDNQRRVRNGELSEALTYLEGRKSDLMEKLRAFQSQSKVNALKEPEDIDREVRSCQTKLDALDVIYEKGLSERKSLQIQNERIAEIIDEVKQKIADEQKEATSMEGLSNLNIQVERVREAIMDKRTEDANEITLTQWSNRLDYDKQLLDQGYLSKAVYDHELAQFEKLKAQVQDSEEVRVWKGELEELYAKIRPSNNKDTSSAPILRDLMLRAFNLELQMQGNEELIAKTKESRTSIANQLNELLASRNVAGAEQWQVQSWRDELSDVDRSIAIVNSLQNPDATDFQIVSPAVASPYPAQSNRRLLAMGGTAVLGLLGAALILATELIRTSVRTCDEVSLTLSEPVLAALAQSRGGADGAVETRNHEQIRLATRSVMQNAGGRKILVLGCSGGDGSSTMTRQIAACLARQQKRVTILDCNFRSGSLESNESQQSDAGLLGLSELLTNPQADVKRTYAALDEPNFRRVSRGRHEINPDLLGSDLMRKTVDRLASDCDYLMIEGPPAGDSTDAEFLAEHIDSVLLVVRSGHCTRSELKQVANRIRQSGKQFLGVILTQLDPGYLRTA